jgi:hypothetical protein
VMQPVLPWHVLRSYTELSSIGPNNLRMKADDLVWITSNKSSFPGQQARMDFLSSMREAKLPLKLYGTGFERIEDKFDGLFPAKYAMAIENYSTEHYWTEKLADSFLSWCLPFYWGAPNIDSYFPKESYISLDIHDHKGSLEKIQDAIRNREWERRLDAIAEARNLVLNKYQFFPFISSLLKEQASSAPARAYHIPANPYPLRYTIFNQVKYYKRRIIQLLDPR